MKLTVKEFITKKHLAGKHNQASHGGGAIGGATLKPSAKLVPAMNKPSEWMTVNYGPSLPVVYRGTPSRPWAVQVKFNGKMKAVPFGSLRKSQEGNIHVDKSELRK